MYLYPALNTDNAAATASGERGNLYRGRESNLRRNARVQKMEAREKKERENRQNTVKKLGDRERVQLDSDEQKKRVEGKGGGEKACDQTFAGCH